MIDPRVLLDRSVERRTPAIATVDLSPAQRRSLVALHGGFSLAYSTAAQEGLDHFGDETGYIAFNRKMGSAFALADPVAPAARREGLVRRFVAEALDPCFVQIGPDTAHILAGLGYQVNRMGVDTRIDLADPPFAGKRNETVRYSERWLLKNGYTIIEDGGGPVMAQHVERLSEQWRANRIVKRREMRFLNRPFAALLGEDMRRFMLIDPVGLPVALLDFDPICGAGRTIGYTTSFKRKQPGVTPHAEIGMTKFACERFRAEGRRYVTLGLSPLARVEASGFSESVVLARIFGRLFESGVINRRIFNLQGQAAFKRRFHGDEEPTYIAFRRASLFQMIGVLRLCKAI